VLRQAIGAGAPPRSLPGTLHTRTAYVKTLAVSLPSVHWERVSFLAPGLPHCQATCQDLDGAQPTGIDQTSGHPAAGQSHAVNNGSPANKREAAQALPLGRERETVKSRMNRRGCGAGGALCQAGGPRALIHSLPKIRD